MAPGPLSAGALLLFGAVLLAAALVRHQRRPRPRLSLQLPRATPPPVLQVIAGEGRPPRPPLPLPDPPPEGEAVHLVPAVRPLRVTPPPAHEGWRPAEARKRRPGAERGAIRIETQYTLLGGFLGISLASAFYLLMIQLSPGDRVPAGAVVQVEVLP